MVFDCFLVGMGALATQCGDLLLARGHRVHALVSPDPRLEHWAARRGVRFLPASGDYASVLRSLPVDYLFSIVNPLVLPAEVLRGPRRFAINYHDSLLPAYAGTHSTTWALLAGEAAHGITWHVMEERVDSGDVLKQRSFDIAPGETSFTLNMRCYEEALKAFAELVEDLEAGRLERRPQDLALRSYHRRSERPAAGGVLSWTLPGEELDRVVRALDFGSTPNPLVCPKIAVGRDFLLVHEVDILDSPSVSPPGTLVGLAGTSPRVATTSRDLALRKVATIDGRPLATAELLTRFRLHKGYRFPELEPETAERLTRLTAALAPCEMAWASRLARLQPLSLAAETGEEGAWEALPVAVPAAFRNGRFTEELVAALALHLSRLRGLQSFDLGLRTEEAAREIRGLESFFAAHVPLRIDLEGTRSFADAMERVGGELDRARRHQTYPRDLAARLPPLREAAALWREPRFEVLVEVGAGKAPEPPPGTAMVFAVDPESGACRWAARSERIREQRQGFAGLLESLVAGGPGAAAISAPAPSPGAAGRP